MNDNILTDFRQWKDKNDIDWDPSVVPVNTVSEIRTRFIMTNKNEMSLTTDAPFRWGDKTVVNGTVILTRLDTNRDDAVVLIGPNSRQLGGINFPVVIPITGIGFSFTNVSEDGYTVSIDSFEPLNATDGPFAIRFNAVRDYDGYLTQNNIIGSGLVFDPEHTALPLTFDIDRSTYPEWFDFREQQHTISLSVFYETVAIKVLETGGSLTPVIPFGLSANRHLDVNEYAPGPFTGLSVDGIYHPGTTGIISADVNGKQYIERDFTAVGTTIPFSTGADDTVPWTIAFIIKMYTDTNRVTFGRDDGQGGSVLNFDMNSVGNIHGAYMYPLSFILNDTYPGANLGSAQAYLDYVDADYVLLVASYEGSVTNKNSVYMKAVGLASAEYESTGSALGLQVSTEFSVGFTESSDDNNYRLYEMLLFNEYASPSSSPLLEKIKSYANAKYGI